MKYPNDIHAPNWATNLLKRFVKEDFLEEIEGDMQERFQDNLRHFSIKKARRLYVLDVLKLLKPALLKKQMAHINPTQGMLKNNLKIAGRQIQNNKVFSIIKIGGFAIGIAACILIALYTTHQVSYDRHYTQTDRIFRLVNQWNQDGEVGLWSNVHGPLKEVLEDNIPEMEKVARVVLWSWGDAGESHVRKIESSYNQYEEGFLYADPELLTILEIPMLYGSQEFALSEPNTMVISKRKADQYFPNENPIGRQMVLNDNPETMYSIGGVMEDLPLNSHFQGDFILTLFGRKAGPGTSGWCCTNYTMYVKITALADKLEVEKKTATLRNSLIIAALRDDGQAGLEEMKKYQSYYLQPVQNIYFNPEEVGDYLTHGSIELVQIFSVIAVIILLLAGINFVHLSIAKSLQRAKEVGLRKVVGSTHFRLIMQYLTESCMFSFLAVIIGVIFAWLSLPWFNQFADTSLVIPWLSTWFIPSLFVGALIVGILSGIYPAFYLSGFQPVEALKGTAGSVHKISALRSAMVIFQFTATVILIVGALVTHRQFQFFMNKSLGYEKDAVINVLGLDAIGEGNREAFKEKMKNLSVVQDATLGDYLPVEGGAIQNRTYWLAENRQTENGFEAARWVIDEDYLGTMGLELSHGRNFTTDTHDEQSIIINERMREVLRLENPLGTQVIDMFDEKYIIVGVVKDFYFNSLMDEIGPLAMVRGKGKSTLSVKINSTDAGDLETTMATITSVWNDLDMKQAFRYSFMDQRFEQMYRSIQRTKTIFLLFAFLSIFVACLGLFALSIFMAEQRQKEISVRKVLGANAGKIFRLLVFDFIKLVMIAIILAIPIAWYLMDQLLQGMTNRIELSWQIFTLAGVLAIVVAFAAISFESLKASFATLAQRLR